MELSQFKNLSSWREDIITIPANAMHTQHFNQTVPNIFIIGNPNLATLKVGITSLPREDSFEFKVDANSTETLGRPIGTRNLYILNSSSIDITINLFSVETTFDPHILKNTNVALEGVTLETNTQITGVVGGATLPVKDDSVVNAVNAANNDIVDAIDNHDTTMAGAINLLKTDTLTPMAYNVYDILTKVQSMVGGTDLLAKLDEILAKEINIDTSGLTVETTPTDLTPVTNTLALMHNKMGYLARLDDILTAISGLGSDDTADTGTLYHKQSAVLNGEQLSLAPPNSKTISKLYYLRCIAGDVTVSFTLPDGSTAGTDTVWLTAGDSINDIDCPISSMTFTGNEDSRVEFMVKVV